MKSVMPLVKLVWRLCGVTTVGWLTLLGGVSVTVLLEGVLTLLGFSILVAVSSLLK